MTEGSAQSKRDGDCLEGEGREERKCVMMEEGGKKKMERRGSGWGGRGNGRGGHLNSPRREATRALAKREETSTERHWREQRGSTNKPVYERMDTSSEIV